MPTSQKNKIGFETRTGSLHIDLVKCMDCESFACINGCSLYGSGILRLNRRLPKLKISLEEATRQCVECLACELACNLDGLEAIIIELPIEELDVA